MLELPEALTIANQINSTIRGRQIVNAAANQSPHKFAWYHGEPGEYHQLLKGKTIGKAAAYGGMVHIQADTASILIGDGVGLRYHGSDQGTPTKHQLLLELDDSSRITASIQMYGGIWCFAHEEEFKNPYYRIAKEKPSPLSDEFNEEYFARLLAPTEVKKLSLKAFLATEQRIPGLGNGVLQDILWRANLNPRAKVGTLTAEQTDKLYRQLKAVIFEMASLRGRDTEKDFFGNPGDYKTVMSKNNSDAPCPCCGGFIKKENYLGGSIYTCEGCQPI